jgi:WS/DGAT/MGAT family acyltransferase
MRDLSFIDLAFFIAETEDSPKHVAGLMLFRKPKNAPADYCRKLIEALKSFDRPVEPFDLVIQFVGLKGPHWQHCEDFNIDEHVFYHKPRRSSSWLQVKEFVARLHEPVMDRTKPLWEYHLVDGIEGGRFAVYTKIHHSYADGMTMARWMDHSLSRSPDDPDLAPVWTLRPRKRERIEPESKTITKILTGLSATALEQVRMTGGLAKLTAQQALELVGVTHKALTLPFRTTDRTSLTGSPTPGRNLATTHLNMQDVKQLCRATRSTLNQVALTCIDGALHRYLEDLGEPIDHPLTIQMPVDLRDGDDSKAGNRLSVALVELAQPDTDVYARHQEIGYSLRNVKSQMKTIPDISLQQHTVLVALAGEVIGKLKLSDNLPTTGHTLVSNLPGPRDQLYLSGAKLEQSYPISLLVPGLRMNITLFSCGDILNFGIIATKDLDRLDNLANYISEEFDNLSKAVHHS